MCRKLKWNHTKLKNLQRIVKKNLLTIKSNPRFCNAGAMLLPLSYGGSRQGQSMIIVYFRVVMLRLTARQSSFVLQAW